MKRENSNIRLALNDRLIVSEAIEAVNRMIRGYSNRGQADKAYIGAIAELLLHYPKTVALGCADPFHGVVRETKFMPTPSDVIAWCEKRVNPMFEEVAREDRIAKQLDEREKWKVSFSKSEALNQISYKEFLEHCMATNQKPRPVGSFEPGGYLGRPL